MSLGLGIFLSSLFLGIIFLFNATKDRWNWEKILLIWPLCFVLIVGVLGGAGFYIYNQYENKPKIYDTYLNIPLNASEADLIFLKGDENNYKNYTEDKSIELYAYISDDQDIFVRLKEGKIWRVSCYSDSSYNCRSLNRVNLHDSASVVRKKIGEPDSVSISDDNVERIWLYDKYNIYMILSKGKVDALGIFEPRLGIPYFNDVQFDFRDLNIISTNKRRHSEN